MNAPFNARKEVEMFKPKLKFKTYKKLEDD